MIQFSKTFKARFHTQPNGYGPKHEIPLPMPGAEVIVQVRPAKGTRSLIPVEYQPELVDGKGVRKECL